MDQESVLSKTEPSGVVMDNAFAGRSGPDTFMYTDQNLSPSMIASLLQIDITRHKNDADVVPQGYYKNRSTFNGSFVLFTLFSSFCIACLFGVVALYVLEAGPFYTSSVSAPF